MRFLKELLDNLSPVCHAVHMKPEITITEPFFPTDRHLRSTLVSDQRRHIVVSTVLVTQYLETEPGNVTRTEVPETMAFWADEHGTVLDWTEVFGECYTENHDVIVQDAVSLLVDLAELTPNGH